MAIIIDGKKIATEIKTELITDIAKLKEKNITPCLALLLVGNDAASEIYVKNKEKFCTEIGIISITKRLPATATESEVLDIIRQ